VKHISIILIACIIVTTLPLSSFAESDTPYPPPPVVTDTKLGTGPSESVPNATAGEIMADITLVRPVSIAAYFIGIGVAILATPIGLATGTTHQIYKKVIDEPYNFFATRPLGKY
jgi:hypothetical protein